MAIDPRNHETYSPCSQPFRDHFAKWPASCSCHLRRRKPLIGEGACRSTRRGTAAVELAVCLPILVLVIMGSLECCGMIFLNQSLHIAAYEGTRVAIRSDATNSDVSARANEILDVRNVQSASISVNPPDVRAVLSGQTLTVTVTAPCDENSIFTPWFFQGRTLVGQTTMIKE